jgi:hypothetical protein
MVPARQQWRRNVGVGFAGVNMDLARLFEFNEWQFFAARAALLAIALLVFAFAFSRWRRAGSRDMQELFTQLRESRGQTSSLAELAQQLVAQVAALQSRIEDRQQLQSAAAGGSQRGYELALKLASHGADPDDIVSATGVTRHEAQLLTRLHNPDRKQ